MQSLLNTIWNTILSIGLAFVIVMVVAYIIYMIGLILVLRRLNRLTWHAFVPLLNYYSLILAINAPKRWFALAQPPYIGAIYVGSGAIKLGRIFNKGPAFSLTWLTLGAPVGMMILARSKEPINQKAFAEKAQLLDIKTISKTRSFKAAD